MLVLPMLEAFRAHVGPSTARTVDGWARLRQSIAIDLALCRCLERGEIEVVGETVDGKLIYQGKGAQARRGRRGPSAKGSLERVRSTAAAARQGPGPDAGGARAKRRARLGLTEVSAYRPEHRTKGGPHDARSN